MQKIAKILDRHHSEDIMTTQEQAPTKPKKVPLHLKLVVGAVAGGNLNYSFSFSVLIRL